MIMNPYMFDGGEILGIRTMLLKHSGSQNRAHLFSRIRDNPKDLDTWK